MMIKKALLTTTMLMFPLAVLAQTPTGPVTGIYLGASGGFNIKSNPNVNNIHSDVSGAAGLTTPNLNLSTGIGGAGVGTVGYGFGNGLRVELEGAYRGNSFSRTSGQNRAGVGVSTGTSGTEQLYGPMVNLDYDFFGYVPWFTPYVGLGLGYQRAKLSSFSTSSAGTAVTGPVTITSGDTRAAFAVQGILGAAFDVPRCLVWP